MLMIVIRSQHALTETYDRLSKAHPDVAIERAMPRQYPVVLAIDSGSGSRSLSTSFVNPAQVIGIASALQGR